MDRKEAKDLKEKIQSQIQELLTTNTADEKFESEADLLYKNATTLGKHKSEEHEIKIGNPPLLSPGGRSYVPKGWRIPIIKNNIKYIKA